MEAVIQSEAGIGETTVAAVAPGDVVGDWAGVDPVSIAGVAVVGCILLMMGGRLLRPALVLTAATVGAVAGLQLAGASRDGSLPGIVGALGIPPIAWVVTLPLLLGIATACLARFALAVLLGGAVGTAVLLIGVTVATAAAEPSVEVVSDQGETVSMEVPAEREQDDSIDEDDAASMVDRFSEAAVEAVLDEAWREVVGDDEVPEVERLGTVVPAAIGEWWREATVGVPPGTLDLLTALAVVTGLCSAMLGVLLPERMAILATAIGGGWLVSGATMAAWVRWMPGATAPTPFLTLLGWAVLAGLGVIHQGRGRRRARRAAGESG